MGVVSYGGGSSGVGGGASGRTGLKKQDQVWLKSKYLPSAYLCSMNIQQ